MELSWEEMMTLMCAIRDAQEELYFEEDNPKKFPEAYAYNQRLEALQKRLNDALLEMTCIGCGYIREKCICNQFDNERK